VLEIYVATPIGKMAITRRYVGGAAAWDRRMRLSEREWDSTVEELRLGSNADALLEEKEEVYCRGRR
jgi:hypothetical protein